MAQRAEHRVGERAVVPRPVVPAAVDEEGRRDERAARARAFFVGVHARLRARFVFRVALPQPQVSGDRGKIVRRQDLGSRHQPDVRAPEALGVAGPLDELGRRTGERVAGEGLVAEDVAQAIAELIADLGDPFVRRTAIRAGVAAVFDKGDRRVVTAQNVIGRFVDGPIEPVASREVHIRTLPPASAACGIRV